MVGVVLDVAELHDIRYLRRGALQKGAGRGSMGGQLGGRHAVKPRRTKHLPVLSRLYNAPHRTMWRVGFSSPPESGKCVRARVCVS